MNRKELVYAIRNEIYEMEKAMKKMHERCENLKTLADDLDASGQPGSPKAEPASKFRKLVDSIYGEKPKAKR